MNKIYLETNLSRIENHLSDIEKEWNEYKRRNDKQSAEEVLIQRIVKSIIQIRYDIGLFDQNNNADEMKGHLFSERRKFSFQLNDFLTKGAVTEQPCASGTAIGSAEFVIQ